MSRKEPSNKTASLRQRLLNRARREARPFQSLATLYTMERFLFRLGSSELSDRFVLKGGLMTMTWAGDYARLTKDIDLLGRGANTVEEVVAAMSRVVQVEVADDGIRFDPVSVAGEHITIDAAYVGVRARVVADFGGMEVRLQLDVGFGDAVVPPPTWFDYPQLLDSGCPRVLGYPPEATLAEKLHAACHHGHANSRMKDYYDLWVAGRIDVTTPSRLGLAVQHTFRRRDTPIPTALPPGLAASMAAIPEKVVQWEAFLRKSGLAAPRFDTVIAEVGELATHAFAAARAL